MIVNGKIPLNILSPIVSPKCPLSLVNVVTSSVKTFKDLRGLRCASLGGTLGATLGGIPIVSLNGTLLVTYRA